MPRINALFLPEFNPQVTEDLAAKSFRPQCLIQKIWQPPAGIQNSESSEECSRDDIFTGGSYDQRTAEFTFSGWLTQTPAFSVKFGEHVISTGIVRGTNSSWGCSFWPRSRHG